MCYPLLDKTLGAHAWGLSAWVDRQRPWDIQSKPLDEPVGLLGHPADLKSGTPQEVEEPVSVDVLFDPKNHAPQSIKGVYHEYFSRSNPY